MVKAKQAAYRSAHKEKMAAYNRQYRIDHPEELKESQAAAYQKVKTNTPWVLLKARAARRGMDFNLTTIEAAALYEQTQCEFCHKALNNVVRNDQRSIDRLDNTKGYIYGNVCCLCIECNRKKDNHTTASLRNLADWLEQRLLR